MRLKLLFVGDVVGKPGRRALAAPAPAAWSTGTAPTS